jgi:hypothetical protein
MATLSAHALATEESAAAAKWDAAMNRAPKSRFVAVPEQRDNPGQGSAHCYILQVGQTPKKGCKEDG